VIHSEEAIDVLKGIDKKGKTKEKLNRAGIHTVGDVKALTLQRVKALTVKGLAEKIAGVSKAGLQKFVDDAARAIDDPVPPGGYETAHHKQENPYQSKYGADWEVRMAASTHMAGYMTVRLLVRHQIECSERAFQDTPHGAPSMGAGRLVYVVDSQRADGTIIS
jgi:hypothetical protein